MKSGLHVCVDARIADGESGGVQQVVLGLAHGLAGLDDGAEEYSFLTYDGRDDWLRPHVGGGSRILHAAAGAARSPWKRAVRALPAARLAWTHLSPLLGRRAVRVPESDGVIERAGADVMHFTVQWAFRTRVPSIYHPHDLQHLHLPQFFDRRSRLEREVLYREFCERARMVAVTSTWIQRDVMRHYGLDEERVRVVPWAAATAAYPVPGADDLRDARRALGLPEQFILYPAQTWPHKNHIRLVEALAVLRDRHGVVVPLVSTGRLTEFHSTIQRRVVELGLSAQVSFLGFVTPLQLQSLYRLARATVIPTRFEAASGPLWEAFLAGSPVACSGVTSLPAQAGDAALVFDQESAEDIARAILRLWREEELRRSLVERGRRNVARFSWDRTARMFRAHYRRIGNAPLTDEDRDLLAAPPLL